MLTTTMRRLLLPFACVALLSACKEGPPAPDRAPPPRPSISASASGASASATASASTSSAAPAPTLEGHWSGQYVAKKGTVELPPRVKDRALAKDDGSIASGAGTLELAIDEAGKVTGTSQGALGELELHGRAEEQTVDAPPGPPGPEGSPPVDAGSPEARQIYIVRTTITPKDPAAPHAMTGIFVGMLKDGAIEGTIRVAGPDATIVREAEIRLTTSAAK